MYRSDPKLLLTLYFMSWKGEETQGTGSLSSSSYQPQNL